MSHIHDTRESTITLLINSNNVVEYYNDNTGNFLCQFKELSTKYHYLSLFRIEYIVLPISWYNVNSNNNLLQYTIGVTTTNLYIEQKNYLSIYSLVNYLGINTPFTLTYDEEKNKITFTHTTGFTISNNSTCLKLIGLSNAEHISVDNIITSDLQCDLSYTKIVNVMCEGLDLKYIGSDGEYKNIIASIPVDYNAYGILNYKCDRDTIITNRNINKLHIYLQDENENEINLNGASWNLCLKFDYVYLKEQKLNESDFFQPEQINTDV